MAALNKSSRSLFWSDHIQVWQSSGMSQSAYCREQGLCPQKFSYWKRKSLTPTGIAPKQVSSGFTRIQVDENSAPDTAFELAVQFPDGTRLLGIPADHLTLKSLIEVLR